VEKTVMGRRDLWTFRPVPRTPQGQIEIVIENCTAAAAAGHGKVPFMAMTTVRKRAVGGTPMVRAQTLEAAQSVLCGLKKTVGRP